MPKLKIKEGPCRCDRPKTSHEVRKMVPCDRCKKLAFNPVQLGCWTFHVRCALLWAQQKNAATAIRTCALNDSFFGRARLCCMGPSITKRVVEIRSPRPRQWRLNKVQLACLRAIDHGGSVRSFHHATLYALKRRDLAFSVGAYRGGSIWQLTESGHEYTRAK